MALHMVFGILLIHTLHGRPPLMIAAVPPMLRFRGGLVFKAHRLLYLPTLDLRVIKKK